MASVPRTQALNPANLRHICSCPLAYGVPDGKHRTKDLGGCCRFRYAVPAPRAFPDPGRHSLDPAGIVVALFYVVLGWIYGAILVATHHSELL